MNQRAATMLCTIDEHVGNSEAQTGMSERCQLKVDNTAIHPDNHIQARHATPKASAVEEDALHLERRRLSNRRNAKRWRVRRKTKFSYLRDQILVLQKEYKELTLEQSKLRTELQAEIDLAKAEASRPNTPRAERLRRALVPKAQVPVRKLPALVGSAPPSLDRAIAVAAYQSIHELDKLHSIKSLTMIPCDESQSNIAIRDRVLRLLQSKFPLHARHTHYPPFW